MNPTPFKIHVVGFQHEVMGPGGLAWLTPAVLGDSVRAGVIDHQRLQPACT